MSDEFEIEIKIDISGKFYPLRIFSTDSSYYDTYPDPGWNPIDTQFKDVLTEKIEEYAKTLDKKLQTCIGNVIDKLVTYDNSYVVKRTIDNMDYYHFILYYYKNQTDFEDIFISIIVGSPKGNEKSSNCNVVKGSINFFSNKVGTFNPSTCKNTCKGAFNVSDNGKDIPKIDNVKKYIEWTPTEGYFDGDCKPYNQYYMIEDKERHPDYPSGQHTHEEHLEYIKESDNNLPLILGLSLGIGIPMLLVTIILIIKRPK